MDIQDLENAPRLSNGAYNLRGAYLQQADLQGANLAGAYLRYANLQGANLRGANLQRANLQNALLDPYYVNSMNNDEYIITNLQGVNLQGARLVDTNLQTTNLQGANLNGAFFFDTDLRNANLQGANLDNTNIRAAKLDGANLTNASMRPSLFRRMVNILPRPIVIGGPTNEEREPLPYLYPIEWSQDEDCVGQEDPVSLESIPAGRGFRLEAENRCYDAVTLAEMKRSGTRLVGPLTRKPFTTNDKKRIDAYIHIQNNPAGGKKRKTKRIRKSKRLVRRSKRKTRKFK